MGQGDPDKFETKKPLKAQQFLQRTEPCNPILGSKKQCGQIIKSSNNKKSVDDLFPRDPITLSEDDWGVQSPPQKGI